MVGLGVLELLHYPDFGIGLCSVAGILNDAPVVIRPSLAAVVDIEPLRSNAFGAHEFHLLGLLIPQRGVTLERVQMEFIEGLLGYGRCRRNGIHSLGFHGIHATRWKALEP